MGSGVQLKSSETERSTYTYAEREKVRNDLTKQVVGAGLFKVMTPH